MSAALRLSSDRAVKIGWALLAGPVLTAVYSLTWGGSRILWLLTAVAVSAALFLLAVGYSWVIIGSSVRVEPDEAARISLIEDRANHDDVRIIDVLVTQCVSVRWFVGKMADRGKDVRLLIHDPEITFDEAQRNKCIQSLYDIVTSMTPVTLARLSVHAYDRTPSVRAIVLRNAKEVPLYASVGWYSHTGVGVGGSRFPAVIFDNRGQAEKLLMKFVDEEVKKKKSTGRSLSGEEIIDLFNKSKLARRKHAARSTRAKTGKHSTKDAEHPNESE